MKANMKSQLLYLCKPPPIFLRKYIVSVTLKAISFREVYAADREALTLNIVLPQEESFISYHGVIKPKLEWYTDYEKDS